MLRPRWFSLSTPPSFLHLATLLVWALVAYSAVVFVLRWDVDGNVINAPSAVGQGQSQGLPEVDALAVTKALGAAPAQSASASVASRFVLVGVMDGGPAQGVALISVDGKPAKPYRVGQSVSENLVVVATGPKKAELGPQVGASSTLVLELPVKK
jgi:general secretion pathway protein C